MNESFKEMIGQAGEGQVVLAGLPFDENSSHQRGPATAPPVIRAALASQAINRWSESGMDLGAGGRILDAGDLEPAPWSRAREEIESAAALALERGALPVFLGGDHAVTYPVLKAFKWIGAVNILHFDAHPDLYDELGGNRESHACPFARIMEEGLAERLVQVGIRTLNGHQRDQARRFGVEIHQMKDGVDELELSFDAPVYVSIDIDGIDPSEAPGVSHREPGGMTVRQVLRILQSFRGKAVGGDIVEFNPKNDPAGITQWVCAKLAKELAARIIADNS